MSPTVEPDPDNAGGGRMHNQAARHRDGLFLWVDPVGEVSGIFQEQGVSVQARRWPEKRPVKS
jgi:hypothetical protein